jgi:hypothetical protein
MVIVDRSAAWKAMFVASDEAANATESRETRESRALVGRGDGVGG